MDTKISASEFNAGCPIGTAVTYTPVRGGPEHIHTQTRSHAWTTGTGHAVVMVEGTIGGVSVEAVTVAAKQP